MQSTPTQQGPVPGLPAEASAPSHGARSRLRRRSSLSAVPTDISTKKRTPTYIRSQTASPEVISSLIDSLAAISQSTQDHFDKLPSSTPTSPLRSRFDISLDIPRTDALDPASYYQSLVSNAYEYPDDACEPPVIRTSKPPSGLSPLTAPKRREKDNSLRSYQSRGAGSATSVQSAQSGRSASSFGAISIEAGIPRKASSDSNRWSGESKRSARGKSLMFMSSREQLRVKEAERKRATISGTDDLLKKDAARKSKTSSQLFSEDAIREESVVAESSRSAHSRSSRGTSPLRHGINLLTGKDGETPVEKGLVPERGSSLKHSGSPRKSKKSHRRKTSRPDSYKTNTVLEEDETVEETPKPKEDILEELEAEEDEVAQRIRELKKQKLLRERTAGKLPAKVDAGAAARGARVSPITSAASSPTSTVSTSSEKRKDPSKAHKVLGIISTEQRASHEGMPATRNFIDMPRRMGHSRARSLTVNDGDEFTPLPINYRLALQALEHDITSSRPSSTASARNSLTPGSPSSLGRANTVAIGGRSAASLRSSTSAMMGVTSAHKHSTSVTNGTESARSFRSASVSEESPSRQHSLKAASRPHVASSPQRRQTLKKKRWSHPDLPLRPERHRSDKNGALNVAVQPPAQAVIEERPTSADSVDMEVEAYLCSPRLSQKIRHPQTGRIISFSEVGDPKGFAVFVCVGMGLTRFVMAFYDQLAATLKLRLITLDRPGIGGSQPDPTGTPLSWPDDVLVVCQALKITKFSLLAHSAGAIYALATSLRMPQHIRGRVHLLAPWIPPSQMAPIGLTQDQPPQTQLPRSQRFLRTLPPSLLKIANATFLSGTSASLQRTGPRTASRTKRRTPVPQPPPPQEQQQQQQPKAGQNPNRHSMLMMDQIIPNASSLSLAARNPTDPNHDFAKQLADAMTAAELARQRDYDERLTFAIWDRATSGANPATDLIVCLETKQTIGFRYEDINRAVVIHHGSKDSRVPVDNVRWLGRLMRKCEVRILEGEQHGLMASAQVMGNVLMEMAADWEDWSGAVSGKLDREKRVEKRRTHERLRFGGS